MTDPSKKREMSTQNVKRALKYVPWHVLTNLLLVYLCYMACRLAFLLENWSFYTDTLTWPSFWQMMRGGLYFDTSAILYTNSLYLLLVFLPFGQEKHILRKVTKWAYVLPNAVCIVANLMDSVYFSFTQHRVTANVFSEFSNEENLGRIIGLELVKHWYFLLLGILLVYLLWRLYRGMPQRWNRLRPKHRILLQTGTFLLCIPLVVCGMRGAWFYTSSRPISMNDAFRFTQQPIGTYFVLNTPFAILKTLKHKTPSIPRYYQDEAVLDSLYSPVHQPPSDGVTRRKNVVILIVESFAQEFIGSRNRDLDNGTYRGYTPFADSLLQHSLTWKETFCNGWTSIDAMPSVLASIPKMKDSFVLSPFSVNRINSLASELGNWGYTTAFFHGAENQSMGFHAFASSAGYQSYYGRDEFYADPRFGGESEFDGTWGVWDEPFLQFFCAKIGEMREPFLTTVFTLSSHHPFAIPEKYKDTFKDEGIHQLHKCIRYTDYALKRFFETASQQPWYANTIFVLCADHASSKTTHAEYKTELGHFRVPILFFDPSGEMPTGCREGIAQQIDIMPTLLGYLGYDRPYIAFGKDLLRTEEKESWAINWQQLIQWIQGDYTLFFDGEHTTAVYNYRNDPLLQTDLRGRCPIQSDMETHLKAFVQSFMQRMKANDVTIPQK